MEGKLTFWPLTHISAGLRCRLTDATVRCYGLSYAREEDSSR
jgi:hypothetical protein